MGKNENIEEKINDSKEYLEKVDRDLIHSIDTFDKLIVSMSSGGLVFSMGFVKDILPSDSTPNYLLLKLSWVFFSCAIISNMLSQLFAYKTNDLDYDLTENDIRKFKGKKQKIDVNKIESIYKFYKYFIKKFNALSFAFFITAVVLLIIFMSIYLK
jgi:hypothetical protein